MELKLCSTVLTLPQKQFTEEWVSVEFLVYSDSIVHHIIDKDTVMSYSNIRYGGTYLSENFTDKVGDPLKKAIYLFNLKVILLSLKISELKNWINTIISYPNLLQYIFQLQTKLRTS